MRKRPHTPMTVRDLRSAERALKTGAHLTTDQAAAAIENAPDVPLPPLLRNYVVGLLRGKARRPRGAGRKDDGFIWEFILADARDLYQEKLAECRTEDKKKKAIAKAAGDILPKADAPANERAAEYVLSKMPELGISSFKTLQNVLSMPLKCEVSAADEIPPDDHDPPDHLRPEIPSRVIT